MSVSAEEAVSVKSLHHFIDGRRVGGPDGETGDVFNPATGALTARVPMAGTSLTREAIAAAHAALPGWADLPALRRA